MTLWKKVWTSSGYIERFLIVFFILLLAAQFIVITPFTENKDAFVINEACYTSDEVFQVQYTVQSALYSLTLKVVALPMLNDPEEKPIYIYYDAKYPCSWIGKRNWMGMVDHIPIELMSRGYIDVHVIDAEVLRELMCSTSDCIVIIPSGVFPDTVYNKQENLVNKWLEAGGTLIWIGAPIGYYYGYSGENTFDLGLHTDDPELEGPKKILGYEILTESSLDTERIATVDSSISAALDLRYSDTLFGALLSSFIHPTNAPSSMVVLAEDDQASFWLPHDQTSITNETSIVKTGVDSCKLVGRTERVSVCVALHDYGQDSVQDWNRMKYIHLWVYGNNSGFNYYFYAVNENWKEASNYRIWRFTDDFTGWQEIIFDIDNPLSSKGALDLSAIRLIAIGVDPKDEFTIHLDQLTLDEGEASPSFLTKGGMILGKIGGTDIRGSITYAPVGEGAVVLFGGGCAGMRGANGAHIVSRDMALIISSGVLSSKGYAMYNEHELDRYEKQVAQLELQYDPNEIEGIIVVAISTNEFNQFTQRTFIPLTRTH